MDLQEDTVVAVTPMYYSIWFNKYLKRDDVLAIELQDTPESIFDRLVFSDENDQEYRDDEYRDAHASYYLKEIKKDITFHKRPFSKITNKYQMNHRSPEEVVKGLIETYGLVKSEKASPPAYDNPWNGRRYTLRVYPAGMSRSVYRVIEISGNDTLNQLCGVILDSYDFGDDWMFTIHVQKIAEAAAYKEAKVIREKLPEWQEAYMERLCQEYIEILNRDENASDRFWTLEKRIWKDKKKAGVQVEMSRSKMIYNIMSLLKEGAIQMEDLEEFSEELKETVRFFAERFR